MHICKFFCLILVHSNIFQAVAMYDLVYQLQCSSINSYSYNFGLNEAPNNNDIMRVANIMLNEAPNGNDAMCVAKNVRLTTMGAQQFSMAAIQPSCRKANLPEMRDNDIITRKVCADGNILCPEKEWRLYAQQFKRGRLISVGRQ